MIPRSYGIVEQYGPAVQRECTDVPWIFGTWDFKWPQGQAIRIAFQELHGGHDLKAAIAAFEHAIDGWRTNGARITWMLEKERLLPAPAEPGKAESVIPREHVEVPYDVLVSFAPLPVVVPPTSRKAKEQEPTTIDTQTSDLGSYARRANYGVPTLFLGPDKRRGGAQLALDAWVDTPDFFATVVHEFGHVLGIAHAHQNPYYRARDVRLKRPDQIRGILRSVPRFSGFPAEEIEPEIVEKWPHAYVADKLDPDRKHVLFSDWALYPGLKGDATKLEHETVMAHPGWDRFLQGDTTPESTPIEPKTRPTGADLELLASMYPVRP